jgi:acyl dehydratase
MSAMLAIGQAESLTRTLRADDIAELRALAGPALSEAAAGEMLVCAMWSTLLGVRLPGPGTNYLKQETRFLAPVWYGEALTARVEITRIRADKGLIDLATSSRDAAGVLIADGRALVQARDTGRLPPA